MTGDEILAMLETCLHKTFFHDTISITRDTTAADVDGWDSLAHVRFIMNVEGEFKVQLSDIPTNQFASIGDIVDVLMDLKAGDV